ncbi:hypothetical protein P3S67_009881 [Capsicum chacoense]
MPPLSVQFHTSSSQNSLHSSSSFVPLISSAPNLSGLRVGGPNTSTSPSMDSATTPSATSVASQNLQFKGVLEYDNVRRLRIIPYRDGFIPQYADAHMVIEIIKPFFNEPWNSWLEIPYKTRIIMWKQFVMKCTWSDCHDNEVDRIFWLKAALWIKEHLYEARNKLVKPSWLNDEVWSKFLILWDTPEYKAKREQGKANRASETGGSLHTGGSMSFATHQRRLKFLNGGVDVPLLTTFAETHMKKKSDGTKAEWVKPHAKDAFGFQKIIEDWRQTQLASEDGTMVQPSPADMTRIWTTVVDGPKKGKTYGIEVNQSSSSSSPMLPNSAYISQNAEEMEAMRTKIEELTQHSSKFAKFEALVKKHMPQVFEDEEDSE